MKRYAKAIVLSMFCSVVVAGCASTKILTASRPDLANPDRLVCEAQPERPAIPPEYEIDWLRIETVQQAKAEHQTFIRSIRRREGAVAGYLVDVEGRLFTCSSNAQWWRDYWAALGAGQ